MMNATRLFLLLALSFQTAASAWATSGGSIPVPNVHLIFLSEIQDDASSASKTVGADTMEHVADSMNTPCDLTENEPSDSASDEGMQEPAHFGLGIGRAETTVLRLDRWYSSIFRYRIPPPEVI